MRYDGMQRTLMGGRGVDWFLTWDDEEGVLGLFEIQQKKKKKKKKG
jgi:hypothetical protein